MQVTISEISPVEKKVAVEIEWPYVAAKLDEAYKDLSKGVALKGFRKGKVPRPMLEKMFGRQVEQVVDLLRAEVGQPQQMSTFQVHLASSGVWCVWKGVSLS